MISSLLVLLTLAAPAIDQDAADASQPQAALATAIPHALALIESKQYEKFIRQYAVPSQLKKVLKQKTLDEIVRGFAKDHAARILLILKADPGEAAEHQHRGYGCRIPNGREEFFEEKSRLRKNWRPLVFTELKPVIYSTLRVTRSRSK